MKGYVTRREARAKVQALEEFKTSNGNLFARWEKYHPVGTPSAWRYVVYSYGEHWPLFIWCDGHWYGNEDKRSVTTSHHRSYAHPLQPIKAWLTCGEMKKLAHTGSHYVPVACAA